MPSSARPKPWHQVVRLKDELRSGGLSLAEFAADLHEVVLGEGRRLVYEDPEKFFALTYPTHALRELVRDVALRLSGQSDKAVRQLELTYGGGKTHTLITLYHLFNDGPALPDLPSVREFREHVGTGLPRARIATLSFDKIDVEKGIEGVRAPDGDVRTLRHPWSVLAFQLAGAEGLRAVHAEGRDEERETPPAEPLLVKLIEAPRQHGLATLILIDEVLMYAREKASLDPVWKDRLVDFFQYLTQAVTKVDRASVVASLLATDPTKQGGTLGRALTNALSNVFRREREEGVQPVGKEDVAEVLRRRFFVPDDIRDSGAYRSHVIGAVRGLSKTVAKFDAAFAAHRKAEEGRFHHSFPFHPDLTDVFYSRWTQLEGFQRTRGILRILATALRGAESWDASPLVGPATLLAAPGEAGVSDAVRELAGVATSEKTEGPRTDWVPLLETELARARQIQDELPALRGGREVEQAVVTVFLHSQPIGHKASTPDLARLSGAAAPDAIDLEKGLARWRELSWFLDDEDAEAAPGALQKSWRLGNRPNLKQMHDEACRNRVSGDAVDAYLEEAIRKARLLTDGAQAAGARVHKLPASPRDVGDDGSFRFCVLGLDAASDSGKPSPAAAQYIDETTGPSRPRVHRNAVVLAVPSRDGADAMRSAARSRLGWEEVRRQLEAHRIDPVQGERLRGRLRDAGERIDSVVRQAYSVVVTANTRNQVHAFKLPGSGEPLFLQIKNDERSRINETAVDAAALLPDGPYDLWREDEAWRRVSDLAGAFSRDPRLPKMLQPRMVLDTLCQGVERGLLVARERRPDGSFRTWWMESVTPEAIGEPTLEVVLPAHAELASLPEQLLAPEALPALWEDGRLSFQALLTYFSGRHAATVHREGYDESLSIPGCSEDKLREAVGEAVRAGTVQLVNGPTSQWKEDLPYAALGTAAELRSPPPAIPASDLTEEALPSAWQDGETNGAALMRALSQARGEPVPWGLVRESVLAAVQSRWLERIDSEVRDGYDQAGHWRLRRPRRASSSSTPPPVNDAPLEGSDIQELAELVGEMIGVTAGYGLTFHVQVTLDDAAPADVRASLDTLLAKVSPNLKC